MCRMKFENWTKFGWQNVENRLILGVRVGKIAEQYTVRRFPIWKATVTREWKLYVEPSHWNWRTNQAVGPDERLERIWTPNLEGHWPLKSKVRIWKKEGTKFSLLSPVNVIAPSKNNERSENRNEDPRIFETLQVHSYWQTLLWITYFFHHRYFENRFINSIVHSSVRLEYWISIFCQVHLLIFCL